MHNIEQIAVLIRDRQDIYEGLRSTLGLIVENYSVDMFVLNNVVEITPEYQENLEWLEELECHCYSNIRANEKFGFTYLNLEEIGGKLKEADLVIPF